MMTEISLNILDIAQNSIRAEASLVEISVCTDTKADTLTVVIKDNGCGMNSEQINKVIDPFYTTRTTRKIGLGIPFFKFAAESTGGSFEISSNVGIGTNVTAVFILSNVDRMPLGDITATIYMLVIMNEKTDFLYTYKVDDREFVLDTKQIRSILGNVSFKEVEVSDYIKEFLKENKLETDNGMII